MSRPTEWNKPLNEPQQQFILYSKYRYKKPEDMTTREVVQTIYAMNKGEVFTNKDSFLLRWLDKILIRLIGPYKYPFRIRQIHDEVHILESDLRSKNIWNAYKTEISMATTSYSSVEDMPDWMDEDRGPELLDVEPKVIEIQDRVIRPREKENRGAIFSNK